MEMPGSQFQLERPLAPINLDREFRLDDTAFVPSNERMRIEGRSLASSTRVVLASNRVSVETKLVQMSRAVWPPNAFLSTELLSGNKFIPKLTLTDSRVFSQVP